MGLRAKLLSLFFFLQTTYARLAHKIDLPRVQAPHMYFHILLSIWTLGIKLRWSSCQHLLPTEPSWQPALSKSTLISCSWVSPNPKGASADAAKLYLCTYTAGHLTCHTSHTEANATVQISQGWVGKDRNELVPSLVSAVGKEVRELYVSFMSLNLSEI